MQNDVLKEYVARGTYIYPPEASLRLVTDVMDFASREVPQWNAISVSGYHMREAGSTAVQELAFTLANGLVYLGAARDRGLDAARIARRMSFFFNAHNHLFEEVAKFRAARKLWAELLTERFGIDDPEARKLRFHTQTAGSMLTAQQPLNNVVRVAVQGLAAILGGTQSLHTNSYDEALGLPGEAAALLALRTQQVLAHESGVTDAADPLAGSYWVESLTAELERGARALLDEIERHGGMLEAIRDGWVQDQIHGAAYRWQREVEAGTRVVIGVNRHAESDPVPALPFRPDPKVERARAAFLGRWRSERDDRAFRRVLRAARPRRARRREPDAADPRGAPVARHARRGVRRDARGVRHPSPGEDRVSEPPKASRVTGLSHVAIAVREADPLVARLVEALGARRGEEELLDGGALRVGVRPPRPGDLRAARAALRGPHRRPLHRLPRRGPASREPRRRQPRGRARAVPRLGVRLIDETPRAGACGSSVAFLHPKSLGGVLIELTREGR